MSNRPHHVQEVAIVADDGYVLTARRHAAAHPRKGRLVVSGATAVPQGFYRRFAEYAASQGFDTLTFDYRGIGMSRPTSLKRFRMDLLDWGRLDLKAAVDAMSHADEPLYVVGHSYGGHAPGLLTNHAKVSGFYVFGTGAGWHGYMPWAERVRVMLMWNVVLPVLTWWKGYCPWKMLGMGEDLPTDAYRQWRHWCKFPRYFFDDPAMTGLEAAFAQVRAPLVAVNALDDLWAPPRSRDAFVSAYQGACVTRTDVDPVRLGAPIGHMGYFRKEAEPLWADALAWFANIRPPGATGRDDVAVPRREPVSREPTGTGSSAGEDVTAPRAR